LVKPLVAFVGRPNVGKSTLFNRVVGDFLAVVSDIPGTTRDRIYGDCEWRDREFTVIDTGGLVFGTGGDLLAQVRRQVELAMEEAQAIVLVVDAEQGLVPADEEVAEALRTSEKPVIVVANKADNNRRRLEALEFYALGLGEPLPVSALHGSGVGDFLDVLVESMPQVTIDEVGDALKIAVLGRPNVGKSSLVNALLGQERVIVNEAPGTTRDAVDSSLELDGERIVIIDTAGLRRRGKVEGIEKYSFLRAIRAIQRADIGLLLIDTSEGLVDQDVHIAGYAVDEGKGLIVLVNKWDLVDKSVTSADEYTWRIRNALKFAPYVPIAFISALTGRNVSRVIPMTLRVRASQRERIPTARLNRLIRDAVAHHTPPTKRGKQLRIYYATQAEIVPPTFIFFVNDSKLVHFSYQRYLENQIRRDFSFEGTPIRLEFRGDKGREA